MPPPYSPVHWPIFAGIPHRHQGPVGVAPADWIKRHRISCTHSSVISSHKLSRSDVRIICQDPMISVENGYICAMAWGGQGAVASGKKHVASSWAAFPRIAPILKSLRGGGHTRASAFKAFSGAGKISGLGISFFTKLLYFFDPSESFYIMDQWTAKSVNLLCDGVIVRMSGDVPSNLNKCGNYQVFCEEIDAMAGLVGAPGAEVEERLFSQGGRSPWPWRTQVKANWPPTPPFTRYSSQMMKRIYPHILLSDL